MTDGDDDDNDGNEFVCAKLVKKEKGGNKNDLKKEREKRKNRKRKKKIERSKQRMNFIWQKTCYDLIHSFNCLCFRICSSSLSLCLHSSIPSFAVRLKNRRE